MGDVTRTERGWGGHFCLSRRCQFRRNTLLESGDNRVVVSTVGLLRSKDDEGFESLGGRYYETMAFAAIFEDPYWESNVGVELGFTSMGTLNEKDRDSDKKANRSAWP